MATTQSIDLTASHAKLIDLISKQADEQLPAISTWADHPLARELSPQLSAWLRGMVTRELDRRNGKCVRYPTIEPQRWTNTEVAQALCAAKVWTDCPLDAYAAELASQILSTMICVVYGRLMAADSRERRHARERN
jgi:hypothetical protein